MNKTKTYILLLPLLIVVSNLFIAAQDEVALSVQDGVPILLRGKVIDKFSKKPTDVKMTFTDKAGKNFSVTPNIIDGHYEQVLISGNSYSVTFMHYNVARETFFIDIPFYEEYVEIDRNWEIKKLDLNNVIYEENAFLENSSELSPDGIALLKKLGTILKFNRGVKFQFNISTEQMPTKDNVVVKDKKQSKNQNKKSKNKKNEQESNSSDTDNINIENKNADQENIAQSILQARIKRIQEAEEINNYTNRIIFNTYTSKNNKNFKVIVQEIKDPLNN